MSLDETMAWNVVQTSLVPVAKKNKEFANRWSTIDNCENQGCFGVISLKNEFRTSSLSIRFPESVIIGHVRVILEIISVGVVWNRNGIDK